MRLIKNIHKIYSLHSSVKIIAKYYLKLINDTKLILFLIISRRFSAKGYLIKCTPEATVNNSIAHRYKKSN